MDVILGKVFRVETKQTQNNKVFTKFSVGERLKKDGAYVSDYYDCVYWGTHPFLSDGQQVICYGQKGTREHNGKTYLTFDVQHIQILTETEKQPPQPQSAPMFTTAQNFEDVPF